MSNVENPRTPEHHQIVSRAEWLSARKELLAKEKELTRHRDAVNAERRRLPMVRIEKDYVFEGPAGKVRLLDLFGERRQLIVYHFMFDPSWDEGCPSCSFLVDNIGHLTHLHARKTSLALVSRAPLAKSEAFKKRMGWTVPWYSSFGSDFNYDFHVTMDETVAPVEYNYRNKAELLRKGETYFTQGESHGLSVFLRDGAGVFHTYSTYARHRSARRHVQLSRLDPARPAGRLGRSARPQRRPIYALGPPSRQVRRLSLWISSRLFDHS
jgi:predicted dithiol-disulfide oxidoreductase (DUF899 family)